MVCKTTSTKRGLRQGTSGSSLVEVLVAIGITGLLMLVLTNVSMLSGRMFVAFANYVDLDDSNRIAMDTMTRDLRECNRVTACSTTQLVIEDADGFSIAYTYSPGEAKLRRSIAGAPPRTLLRGCDTLSFNLGTRNPIGSSFGVVPTTDVNVAKVVNVSWNCSRAILGIKANTENVQTARIVIRRQSS